jgi:phosphatidylglycerol:prolipoprotein diacylglycerol transferase
MHVHPHPGLHPVFEALAYAVGYAFYKLLRARNGDALNEERRWLIIAATAMGALAGSRILGLLEQAPRVGFHWQSLLVPGGKTIVGGLLGGWLAVEIAKPLLDIHTRTGDLFAIPLCLGIAIGRIGCFLAGLADDTYGKPTSLPWAIDFGDGIPRHPTQLYEIAFLLLLAAVLYWLSRRPHGNGALFRVFMAAYLTWRLLIDFIKPQPLLHGMNVIQWACVAGLMALAIGAVTHQPKMVTERA